MNSNDITLQNAGAASPMVTVEELHATHEDIVILYDLVDELIDTTSDERCLYKEEQVALLQPLVEQVLDATDDMHQDFCQFAEAGDKQKAAKQFRLRTPFKSIFAAVNGCLERIQELPAEVGENITAMLMPVVEKLVKHTEKLFTKLVVMIERARDVVRNREEFYNMITREAHIAALVRDRIRPDFG